MLASNLGSLSAHERGYALAANDAFTFRRTRPSHRRIEGWRRRSTTASRGGACPPAFLTRCPYVRGSLALSCEGPRRLFSAPGTRRLLQICAIPLRVCPTLRFPSTLAAEEFCRRPENGLANAKCTRSTWRTLALASLRSHRPGRRFAHFRWRSRSAKGHR